MFSGFTNPNETARYRTGMLFLGVDDDGQEIGIQTERHALTVAGPRSGKGAALIIPNLKRWPHSALTVDPKGENAEASFEEREAMGQTVGALDPFRVAKVPDRLRVSCNLLAHIDPNGLTAREDIRVIADGTVIRFKAEDGMWDNGAVSVIAGVIDYVLTTHPPEERDLTAVRRVLALPPDALVEAFKEMAETPTRTGLARAAGAIGLSESKKNREFVTGAVEHTEWLDSPAMADMLRGDGGFDLAALKTGKASLYLVLPPKYLAEHGRFLRLFVRAALDAMSRELEGGKCLFVLDEFFSLGHIDQISKAAGLMPGYGVHLWPILQNLGQLTTLYKIDGAENFYASADAHIFFGVTDPATLKHISESLGRIGPDEVPHSKAEQAEILMQSERPWPDVTGMGEAGRRFIDDERRFRSELVQSARHLDAELNRYAGQHIGQPRVAPDAVRELIAKKDGDKVARHMIVFAKGRDVFKLRLWPYFEPKPPSLRSPEPVAAPYDLPPLVAAAPARDWFKPLRDTVGALIIWFVVAAIGWSVFPPTLALIVQSGIFLWAGWHIIKNAKKSWELWRAA